MRTEEKPLADSDREEHDTTRDTAHGTTAHDTATERLAVVERLSALQGYLALVLLAAGIGFELGPGWGVAVLGLGLFADAWRDTELGDAPREEKS